VDEQHLTKLKAPIKIALGLSTTCAGAGLVVAGFKFSYLNWVVDGPGWIVSRFVPIDFHEGDGAFGFLLAILVSWLWTSLLIFSVTYWGWQHFKSGRLARDSSSAR